MLVLEVPVKDVGTGRDISRRVMVVGVTAHIGDEQTPAMFRLHLAELSEDGRRIPIGVDSIGIEYLSDFLDQLSRLLGVLMTGGGRDWAGQRIEFGQAKPIEACPGLLSCTQRPPDPEVAEARAKLEELERQRAALMKELG